jgi:hypothetical protein
MGMTNQKLRCTNKEMRIVSPKKAAAIGQGKICSSSRKKLLIIPSVRTDHNTYVINIQFWRFSL